MGTIAAPLLAGFSLSTFVLVLTLKASDVRYPDFAALLLLLAAVFLILAVQATISARGWWPDQQSRGKMSKADQDWLTGKFKAWSIGATIAYDLGLLCLLAGLTVLAVPPVSGNPTTRWAAVAVGAIAFIVTLCWTIAAFWPRKPAARA
jgi:hypothetical protein